MYNFTQIVYNFTQVVYFFTQQLVGSYVSQCCVNFLNSGLTVRGLNAENVMFYHLIGVSAPRTSTDFKYYYIFEKYL